MMKSDLVNYIFITKCSTEVSVDGYVSWGYLSSYFARYVQVGVLGLLWIQKISVSGFAG